MQDHHDTRRSFLTSGALLATSALLFPHTADAEAPADASERATHQLLWARIADALDRPLTGDAAMFEPRDIDPATQCQCARCRAIRRSVLTCTACGYVGAPVVTGCECRESLAENRALYAAAIPVLQAGRTYGDLWTPAHLPYLLRHREEERTRPDQMCSAHADKTVRARNPHNCGHGAAYCPACGTDTDGTGAFDDATFMLARVRAVRAVLDSYSVTHGSKPIAELTAAARF